MRSLPAPAAAMFSSVLGCVVACSAPAIVASGLNAPDDNDEILTWIGGSDAADEGEWFWAGNGAITGSFQFWTGGSPPGGGAVDGAYVACRRLNRRASE